MIKKKDGGARGDRSNSRDSKNPQQSFVALRNKNMVNKSREYTMQELDKMTSTFNSVMRSASKPKRG